MEHKKNVSEFSDIELAELAGTAYQELMRIQANLTSIGVEIAKRKEAQKKPEGTK